MRRNVASIPNFVSLILLIYTVELVTNPERNKENLVVQTCKLSDGTSTEMSVSPFKLNMSVFKHVWTLSLVRAYVSSLSMSMLDTDLHIGINT